MLFSTIFLIIGFILLIKGADYLVDGSSVIAKKFKVSNLLIGLTIVSFGTSLPELVVNVLAGWQGNTELAIANIIGSNIANLLLILGVSAVVAPLVVGKHTVWKEIPFSLLAVMVLGILANDKIFAQGGASVLSFGDGLILLSFLAIFMYYIIGIALSDRQKNIGTEAPQIKTLTSVIMIIGGLVGLIIGGRWVVDSATFIATSLGVSQAFIGLTAVALGTSLPELVASITAVKKGNIDLAVGNAIGSNVFNVFWILGVTALIHPLYFNTLANTDLLVAIGATLLLFFWMFIGKKHTLQKWQGILFLVFYVGYIVFAFFRG